MYTVNRLNPVHGKTQYRLGSRQDYILYGTTNHPGWCEESDVCVSDNYITQHGALKQGLTDKIVHWASLMPLCET